jgi:serine protease AprX
VGVHVVGVGVAVLDTGIYPHVDFGDRIVAFRDFTVKGAGKAGQDVPYDDNSHGTHVAGIIAGDGSASRGRYVGVAPKSRIIALKVLEGNGDGDSQAVVEGLQWILDNERQYGIRVVNLSFAAKLKDDEGGMARLLAKVGEVWEAGIVVVTVAGNLGPGKSSVAIPGISRHAITVGVYDDDYYVDSMGRKHHGYSGRGPGPGGIVKPEIVTRGTGIISCTNKRAAYARKSGTSMAAPRVSGAVALLLEKKPVLTPDEVKERLIESAVPMKLPREHQGYGRLDVGRLLATDVNNM